MVLVKRGVHKPLALTVTEPCEPPKPVALRSVGGPRREPGVRRGVIGAIGAMTAFMLFAGCSLVAGAQEITIATASEAGVYNTVMCPAIVKHVSEATKGKAKVKCLPSEGTGANIEAVRTGKVQFALAQFDVLAAAYAKDEMIQESVISVGNLGPEALFCVGSTTGRVQTAKPLFDTESPGKKYRIGVGNPNGGTAAMWTFLQSQNKRLGANAMLVNTSNYDLTAEISRLRSGVRDLTCFVQGPNPQNERIKEVLATSDVAFVGIDATELAGYEINNARPYVVAPAQVKGGFRAALMPDAADTLTTLQTRVTVIYSDAKVPPPVSKLIKAAVLDPKLLPSNSPSAIAKDQLTRSLTGAGSAVRDAFKGWLE